MMDTLGAIVGLYRRLAGRSFSQKSRGYALAAFMAILIIALPASVWMLGAVFALGGIYVGIEETLGIRSWFINTVKV